MMQFGLPARVQGNPPVHALVKGSEIRLGIEQLSEEAFPQQTGSLLA